MAKVRNVNDVKTDKRSIVTTCGIAAIKPSKKEENAVNRYIMEVRNDFGGDLFDVIIRPEYAVLPVNSDKKFGPYLGDKKSTEFMWINLFHYMYWKNRATQIEEMVQQFLADYPAVQENIADVYRWARETYINNELTKRGRAPIYAAAMPKFNPYANIAMNAEGFFAYSSSAVGNIIQFMEQNGASPEYVEQTIQQLVGEIDQMLRYYSDTIAQDVANAQQQSQQAQYQMQQQAMMYPANPQGVQNQMYDQNIINQIQNDTRQAMIQQYAANQTQIMQQNVYMMQQQGVPVQQINEYVGQTMQQINDQVVAFTGPQMAMENQNFYVPKMDNGCTCGHHGHECHCHEEKAADMDISAAVLKEEDTVKDFGNISNVDFYPIDEPDMGHPNAIQTNQNPWGMNESYGAMGNNPFVSTADYTGNF